MTIFVIDNLEFMGVMYCMEMIDIYDELGQKSGKTEEKYEAHRNALIHKGVCVWIINSNDEILLQTRNSQVMFPNMMDISFSGHIQAGETSLEAAIREGKEELGIDLEIDKLQYLFSCREYGEVDGYFENEIDDVFLYRTDILLEEYSFCDNEVKEVSYVSLEKLKIMVETNSTMLMPYKTHYIFLLTALSR
jgi:isopentenyl-diphosphate delta-isomerase